MDFGELNKIAGGVIGALLAFLLLGFVSEQIFVGSPHDDEDRVLAFAVEVEEDTAGGEAEAAPDFAALLASADASAGEKVFNKCKACHQVEDGANGVGPHLFNVVGRDIASVDGYSYSDALQSKEGEWTLENLFGFLHNPGGWAPGTKMGFAGLPDEQDRVNIIVWLNEAGGSPVEFKVPEAPAGESAKAGTGDAATEAASEGEGVASSGEPTTEANAADEEEAEAKLDAAAEAGESDDQRDSEQASGTDEIQPDAGTSGATTGGDGEQQAAAGGGKFAPLLASADASAGEKVFRKCKACHKLEDGKNGVGPYLWGVVGRDIASVEGFKYSDALHSKDGAWTLANLDAFLTDPKGWAPGTKMSFAGLDDPQARVDVITYLNEADGSPEQLSAAGGAATQTAPVDEGSGDSAEAAEATSEPGSEATASPSEVTSEPAETTAEAEVNTTTGVKTTTGEETASSEATAQAETDPEAPVQAEATDDSAKPAAADQTPDEPAADAAQQDQGASDAASQSAEGSDGAGGKFAPLLASADASAGEKVFRKCKACHKLEDGKNAVGPYLWGVVGRDIASVEGFKYSDALQSKDGAWTLANLDAFLTDPKGWAPGTKMTFAGLDDPQDRINVITYLNEADGSPEQLGAADDATRERASIDAPSGGESADFAAGPRPTNRVARVLDETAEAAEQAAQAADAASAELLLSSPPSLD